MNHNKNNNNHRHQHHMKQSMQEINKRINYSARLPRILITIISIARDVADSACAYANLYVAPTSWMSKNEIISMWNENSGTLCLWICFPCARSTIITNDRHQNKLDTWQMHFGAEMAETWTKKRCKIMRKETWIELKPLGCSNWA